MKITDIRTVLLTGPCTDDPWLTECRRFRSAAFIEIHTDTEFIGVGETYNGYRCAEIIPLTVEYFKPILINQSLDDVGELYQRMYHCENFWCRTGLGLTVLNGIEAALLDLKGKAEGVPVYELLGGRKHESLLAYATGGPSNYPLDRLAHKLEFYQSLGFCAAKLGTGYLLADGSWGGSCDPAEAAELEAEKMTFVRDRFGHDMKIMLDGHMGNRPDLTNIWQVPTAKAVMKAVEPFDLLFFEEPLHYDDPWGYAELSRSTTVPIAGGECLTGLTEWRQFIEMDCFDIGQPDASFTGGLEMCVQIAGMLAERGDRSVAMHAWGAGPSLMQNVHVGFACQNTVTLEVPPAYGPLHSLLIGDALQIKDGRVQPPDEPGLGVTLTDDVKNRFPFIPGSGEFNCVAGKNQEDYDDRTAELVDPSKW